MYAYIYIYIYIGLLPPFFVLPNPAPGGGDSQASVLLVLYVLVLS